MEKSYHLAFDLGATSGRAILGAFDGHAVDMHEISRFTYPILDIDGHLHWDLPLIHRHVTDGIRRCHEELAGRGALSSIGIDSWGCDVAFFNADGSPAGLPYCYRDPHTAGAAEAFCRRFGKERLYAATGIQFMDFNTLFQLDRIRPAAARILFMPDALAYMLTGRAITEYTVASTSQMVNLATRDLDPEILEAVGLSRDRFGAMVQPGEKIGEYGGVPVLAVAGHDTASAVIGIPAPDPDYAYLSCGTWALLGVESPRPVAGEKSLEYNFTNEGGIDGTVRLLKNICGMWIFERVRHELGHDGTDIAALAAMCDESSLNTIINPDDPAFAAPASMTGAISRYCADRGLSAPASMADYVRVIYRSLAARVAEVMEQLRRLSPRLIRRLHVIGGGSRNTRLMQMLATATGLPVVAGPAESTALGNILVQARSLNPGLDIRQTAINSTKTITYLP